MKYPDNFKNFNGKFLSDNEIDELVQDVLSSGKDIKSNEFDDFRTSLWTGNTKVELYEFNHIKVWQLVASYWEPD